MREILFRGKSVSNNEWVEGFYEYSYMYDSLRECHRIIWADKPTRTSYLSEVVPETVGQYTGLTDKNGKKIFEGDIVDCWSEGVNAQGAVQQRRDGLWIIYPAWQKHIMWGLCPDEYSHTTVEVIGNVHDNPELIKT